VESRVVQGADGREQFPVGLSVYPQFRIGYDGESAKSAVRLLATKACLGDLISSISTVFGGGRGMRRGTTLMDDQTLMRRAAVGDIDEFAELCHRHYDWAYSLAYRLLRQHADADDVVQLAFLKLWLKRSDYDLSKEQVRGLLRRIVTNEAVNTMRSWATRPTTGLEHAACEQELSIGDDATTKLPGKLTDITNLPGWENLSDREKVVVTAHYMHPNFPYFHVCHADVARQLGMTEENARQTFHRAKKKLLAALEATRASVEGTPK
jgi:RNA polymerase sigma-70 factor (ECF subfamily)